jgi:predicted nucleotidyltransferase
MSEMNILIISELERIEREENVRILYACESGSRAWGFASKDSDYDVRFIYIRPEDWYLSLLEKRDVIERPISGLLDINGWDLKKALNLFRKSNPPLLEWLQSPIVYKDTGAFAEHIRSLSSLTFSPKSCMYHYLHMARGNYREYLQGEQVKIKKYFYVLRPILACEWIERTNTMPPIQFEQLVDRLVPEGSELRSCIAGLLERKRDGDEMDWEPKIDPVNHYLQQQIAYYEHLCSGMREAEGWGQDERLDRLFRATLKQAWQKKA